MYFFFFNDTATTEIYTLSLHDALPILSDATTGVAVAIASIGGSPKPSKVLGQTTTSAVRYAVTMSVSVRSDSRSEEHTSELQSPCNLVCRLLLAKKKLIPTFPYNRATC